jgi:hypothetical protein
MPREGLQSLGERYGGVFERLTESIDDVLLSRRVHTRVMPELR